MRGSLPKRSTQFGIARSRRRRGKPRDEIGKSMLPVTPVALGLHNGLKHGRAFLNIPVDEHIIVLVPMRYFSRRGLEPVFDHLLGVGSARINAAGQLLSRGRQDKNPHRVFRQNGRDGGGALPVHVEDDILALRERLFDRLRRKSRRNYRKPPRIRAARRPRAWLRTVRAKRRNSAPRPLPLHAAAVSSPRPSFLGPHPRRASRGRAWSYPRRRAKIELSKVRAARAKKQRSCHVSSEKVNSHLERLKKCPVLHCPEFPPLTPALSPWEREPRCARC